MLGDFNYTLEEGERKGISIGFANWVHGVGLNDGGFVGPIFTWKHGRNALTRRSSRLSMEDSFPRSKCQETATFPFGPLSNSLTGQQEHTQW